VEILYEDNGVGLLDDIRKKLFEEGKGRHSGYGLYLIKWLCNRYGWTMNEEGTEGERHQIRDKHTKKTVEILIVDYMCTHDCSIFHITF
jgi:sensor histidine kinase regulating citrate/malate metabolism